MTSVEFNEKWEDYLGDRHYGLAIDIEPLTVYLDKLFEELTEIYPDFEYYQIKLKFNDPRFYTNLDGWSIESAVECKMKKIIKAYEKSKEKSN